MNFVWRTPEGSILHVSGRTNHLEIAGDGGDGITMRHPYLRVLFETTEQGVGGVNRLEVGTSVLARISLFHLATEGVRDELGAIANAQHGQATYELAQIDLESLRVVSREPSRANRSG